jgi:hypothetical protein
MRELSLLFREETQQIAFLSLNMIDISYEAGRVFGDMLFREYASSNGETL